MENNYTYEDAFAELQQIVGNIESGEINVDELSEKVTRASELIAVCKAKLTATEEEVEQLLAKLQPQEEVYEEEVPETDEGSEEEEE